MDLEKALNDKLTATVIKFFHENQSAVDSIDDISRWTGINKRQAEKAISQLVRLNVVIPHPGDSVNGFGYTQDRATINRIARLLSTKIKE